MATLIQEVGKLIAGELLAGRAVSLPECLSLQVRRIAARRISSRLVEPPHRVVEISFSPVGRSLVEIIQQAAHCTEDQARDAYERWLAKSRDEQGVLRVEGVGTIRHKSFVADPSFESRMNPQGRTPLKIKRPMPWWAWSTITLLGIFALFGGATLLVDPLEVWNRYRASRQKAAEPTSEVVESLPVEEQIVEPITELATEPTEQSAVEPVQTEVASVQAVESTDQSTSEAIARTQFGKSYVVLGIYSTEANARRAVRQAVQQYQLPNAACQIFLYNEKFLVALGEFPSRAKAKEVAFQYRTNQGIADVWVYTKQ